MNKISKKITILLLILSATVLFASADGVYSSQEDPLVSLSYVNDVLAPQIVSQVMEKVEKEYVRLSDISAPIGGGFTLVTLKNGQNLQAASCCEIIVIGGSVKALITNSSATLIDLTTGTTISNGANVLNNHYVVIPKADGRGVSAASDNTNILIRGEYNIPG